MSLESDLKDLANPNVRTYLDAIAKAEGVDTSGPNGGYDMMFRNQPMASMADHPRQYFAFTQTDGKKNSTSAAGKYQFLDKTWRGLAKSEGLTDFSPLNQDRAALALIRQNGALDSVRAGRFNEATPKLGKVWASLPSSTYAQPKRSDQEFVAMLNGKDTTGMTAMAKNAPAVPTTPEPLSDPFLLKQLENELIPLSGSTPTVDGLFASVAPTPAAPPETLSFNSSIFGESPKSILTAAANRMWDNIDIPPVMYGNQSA